MPRAILALREHSRSDAITNSSSEMFPVAPGTVSDAELASLISALHPIWISGLDGYDRKWASWSADDLIRCFGFGYMTAEEARAFAEWAEDDGIDGDEDVASRLFGMSVGMEDGELASLVQHAAVSHAVRAQEAVSAVGILAEGTPYVYCDDSGAPLSFFHLLARVLSGTIIMNR